MAHLKQQSAHANLIQQTNPQQVDGRVQEKTVIGPLSILDETDAAATAAAIVDEWADPTAREEITRDGRLRDG